MNEIQEGDIVDVFYCDSSRIFNAKVLHVACDTGDLWIFKDSAGRIYAQNPQSSNFDYIVKRTEFPK